MTHRWARSTAFLATAGATSSESYSALVLSGSCEGGDGRWTATGTAINPTDANVDYRIYVSFLDTAGETLALVETDLGNVAPNTPVEWTADSPISANGLHCVLRTERHTRSSS